MVGPIPIAYINKQGGTHSHALLWLVVDLFLWLQIQDITIRARHIQGGPNQPITTKWSLHPKIVKQIFGTWGNSSSGYVCHSPQHTSSQVHVSSSRASSTGDRSSVTRLAGEVDVHVSTVPPAQQSFRSSGPLRREW